MAQIIDSYSEANQSGEDGLASTYDTAVGQSFTGDGGTLNSAKFYIYKEGSPTGNAYAKIYAHTGVYGEGGLPTGSALATSDALDVSTLDTEFQLETFTFSGVNQITLTNGVYYCVVLEYTGGDDDNQIRYGYDYSSATHLGNIVAYQGFWYCPDPTWDLCFYVYKEGRTLAGSRSLASNRSMAVNREVIGSNRSKI